MSSEHGTVAHCTFKFALQGKAHFFDFGLVHLLDVQKIITQFMVTIDVLDY